METGSAQNQVQELQGLDGAFTFPEQILQRIWARGEWDDTNARDSAGRSVRVLHPGRWNRMAGPDFRNARLRLDGRETTGDVELHLHAGDWEAHGHDRDPAYSEVALHAVLFPSPKPAVNLRADGVALPVLVLLPLLRRALEEHAEEDAVEHLAQRPGCAGLEELIAIPPEELPSRLRAHAERRWLLKTHHASVRIARLGWIEACHHTALEILGYRFNRGPMLRVATRWPLACWEASGFDVSAVCRPEAGNWIVQGVRPANRPARRLAQYAAWVAAVSRWPLRLEGLAPDFLTDPTQGVTRPRAAIAGWRREIAGRTGAGVVGAGRLDNLISDGFLPLLAARTGWEGFDLWSRWPAGDGPEFLREFARLDAVRRPGPWPRNQGFVQGVLGWLIEQERRLRRR